MRCATTTRRLKEFSCLLPIPRESTENPVSSRWGYFVSTVKNSCQSKIWNAIDNISHRFNVQNDKLMNLINKLNKNIQAFMLILLLICLGEWFSSPAVPLADSATLYACRENPKDVSALKIPGWNLSEVRSPHSRFCHLSTPVLFWSLRVMRIQNPSESKYSMHSFAVQDDPYLWQYRLVDCYVSHGSWWVCPFVRLFDPDSNRLRTTPKILLNRGLNWQLNLSTI